MGGKQSIPTASFSSFRLLVKTAHLHQHPVATSTFFLFLSRNRANHRRQRRKEKKHFLVLFIFFKHKTTMKLALIRSAYMSLRAHQVRPGSRFTGFSRRCLPIGITSSRLSLRAASATSSTGTNPKLTGNFGVQSQKGDESDYDNHMR